MLSQDKERNVKSFAPVDKEAGILMYESVSDGIILLDMKKTNTGGQ